MTIHGLTKLTLLDFPEHIACTVFTGTCNFRCPYCHNAGLVLNPNAYPAISEGDFFEFLESRKNKLEGVCITGGEPTLQKDLPDFIKKITALGFKCKLDTNGYLPDTLKALLDTHLLSMVSMDIKNSPEKYALTAGFFTEAKSEFETESKSEHETASEAIICASNLTKHKMHTFVDTPFDFSRIQKSIDLLKSSGIPHEFRTTVVKELHDAQDIESIARLVGNDSPYFLQSFKEADEMICKYDECPAQYSAYTDEEIEKLLTHAGQYCKHAQIRGK